LEGLSFGKSWANIDERAIGQPFLFPANSVATTDESDLPPLRTVGCRAKHATAYKG